jgi:GT2 family glycosyltransferase
VHHRVSVIIPTRHRPALLAEVLASIAAQTVAPTEVLVGDDSTDDRTRQLIEADEARVRPFTLRYIHNQPPLGESGNVDALYRAATGDLVLHLHDDDPLYPRCLELLLRPFQDHPDVVASFGLQYLLADDGTPLPDGAGHNRDFFRTPERAGLVDGRLAGATGMFPNNGFLVRRDAAVRVGYGEGGRAGRAVDFSFGFRLGLLGLPMYFVHELTTMVRLTTGSVSRSADADNAYHTVRILLDHFADDHIGPEVATVLARNLPTAVRTALQKRERARAWRWTWSRWYRPRWTNPRWYRSVGSCLWP